MLDIHVQHEHQHHGDEDDHDARVRRGNGVVANIDLKCAGDQCGNGHVTGALAHRDPVLQENGHADGRNERHQARPATQRRIRHLFDRVAVHRSDQHGYDQHDEDDEWNRKTSADTDCGKRDQPDVGANHVDFAVSEVDHSDDAIDHRVANGDQRIDRAERQSVEELLHELGYEFGHKTKFHDAGPPVSSRPGKRKGPAGSLERIIASARD